jgi:hypothetical protein
LAVAEDEVEDEDDHCQHAPRYGVFLLYELHSIIN